MIYSWAALKGYWTELHTKCRSFFAFLIHSFTEGGEPLVGAEVSIASAAIVKANDAREMTVTSPEHPRLFLLDGVPNGKSINSGADNAD